MLSFVYQGTVPKEFMILSTSIMLLYLLVIEILRKEEEHDALSFPIIITMLCIFAAIFISYVFEALK